MSIDVKTLPPYKMQDYYDELAKTGPGTLGGKWLRKFWHAVALSSSLPVGRAKTIKLLSEEFTLYRGESGKVHLTESRCPHRLVKLGVGFVENESIRCMYHGWKFGADGTCEDRPGEANCGDISIKTYPADEFLGLIYVYIGEEATPDFPPYAGFEGEGILENRTDYFPCSYLQSYENDFDIYHANFTHSTGEIHGPADKVQREAMYQSLLKTSKWSENEHGIQRDMSGPNGVVNTSIMLLPGTIRLLIPTFNEIARRHGGPHFRQTYLIHTPIDDYTHNAFAVQQVPLTGQIAEDYKKTKAEIDALEASGQEPWEVANDIFAGKRFLQDEDVKAHPMLVAVEDLLTQVSQGDIVDRHAEKLGRSDEGVVLMRRVIARELHALANGKETTQWKKFVDVPKSMTGFTF